VDISLADVLLHFQKMPYLGKFGILGFYRLNGWNQSNRAYKRSHVTSTVILNLEKLKNVEYLKKAFIWEDLQFNRDAENVSSGRGEEAGGGGGEAAVICKCYRFAFSTPQLRGGGCHDMVANKAGLSVDTSAVEDTLDGVAHKETAKIMIVQKEEEPASALEAAAAQSDISAEPAPNHTDTLQKMLRVLGLADRYLETLESEMMDFDTLNSYLDNWGIDKLLHELKEVGVDKAGTRMKIANYLWDKKS